MDTKVLIIILLGSLTLIVGAVIALWWRSRASGASPSAPAPMQRRDEAPEKRKKEAQEPPRGQPPIPPAPSSPPSVSAPMFGGAPPPASAPKPTSTGVMPPAPPPPAQAPNPPQPELAVPPAGSYQPLPPVPKPQAPGAIPATPAREEKPPMPIPAPLEEQDFAAAPETEEDETEMSAAIGGTSDDEESGILPVPAPEPVPALPLLDLDEMAAEELVDFMKEAASATPDDAEITRSGEATVNIETLGKAAQSVLFSAYYPKEIAPQKWEPLHAYIFRALAAAVVETDAGKQLGARAAEFRGVRAPAQANVPEGALVTATPHMEGFHFNPPSLTVGFYKDWHRFDFEVRAKDAPLNQSTNGLLTFGVEGIIVADVPLSIYVGETTEASSGQANAVAKAYEAIFCSYSHKDQHIVARAERAYKALGLDYLRDVVSLKSGQEWSDELLTLINRADIFQLFWSQASAQSEHVRFEWEHALQVAGWRANFIRPVYWEDPKPHIPDELKHIHFAYQPDLGT